MAKKEAILKYGYLRQILPVILAIALGFLFKSVGLALVAFAVCELIIMYYYILKHNLLVGYSQFFGGSWGYKANKSKGWIIIYTIINIAILLYGLSII